MGKRKRPAVAASPSRSVSCEKPSSESRGGGSGSESGSDSAAWRAFDAELQAELQAQAAQEAADSPPTSPAAQAVAPRLPASASGTSSLALARPAQSGSALALLPAELLRRILRWLSSDDLCAAGACCFALRHAASEAEPWRRLYRLRWPAAAGEADPADWRAALRERDAEELRAVEAGPLAEIFRMQLIARRAQAPTAAALAADEAAAAAAAGVVPAALAAWRRHNWASAVAVTAEEARSSQSGDAAQAPHRCSARCAFAPLPLPAGAAPVAVCVASGRPHACDDGCREERRGPGGEVTVLCAVTGAVHSQFFEDADEGGGGDEAAAAGAEDDATAFLPGSFGRAYAVGYECTSEAELRAVMWGGAVPGSSCCGGGSVRRRKSGRKEE